MTVDSAAVTAAAYGVSLLYRPETIARIPCDSNRTFVEVFELAELGQTDDQEYSGTVSQLFCQSNSLVDKNGPNSNRSWLS